MPSGPQHDGDSLTGSEDASMPSYSDLHITTASIPRTSIFNLPYGFEVKCTRVTGWVLYDNGTRMSPHLIQPKPSQIAGEYDDPEKWLVLDVDGHVIVDSRRAAADSGVGDDTP